jgi:hypothetical protein
VGCALTAAECFRKHVAANDRLGLKAGKDGWWSMRCPAGHHGKPLRLRVGNYVHLFYTDLGDCPEDEVFSALVKLGFPAACLKPPKDAKVKPCTEEENRLAGSILDIGFGEGTATERMVAMIVASLDGELPEGPMVGVLAAKLRVSPASIYRATAEVRRSRREPSGYEPSQGGAG